MVIRLKYKILIITLIFVALLSLSNVCAVDVNLSEDDVVLNDTHYKNINLDNSDEYCNSNVKEVFGKNNNSQNNFRSRSEECRVGKECRSRWSPYH